MEECWGRFILVPSVVVHGLEFVEVLLPEAWLAQVLVFDRRVAPIRGFSPSTDPVVALVLGPPWREGRPFQVTDNLFPPFSPPSCFLLTVGRGTDVGVVSRLGQDLASIQGQGHLSGSGLNPLLGATQQEPEPEKASTQEGTRRQLYARVEDPVKRQEGSLCEGEHWGGPDHIGRAKACLVRVLALVAALVLSKV